MEFLLGVVAVLVVFFLFAKRNTDRFNKTTLQPFSSWLQIYESSDGPTRHGLSIALLIQTLHLAQKMGVIPATERKQLEVGMRKEDPVRIINEWMEVSLSHITELGGKNILNNISARDAGLYMLICVKGVNPRGDLRRFLQQLDSQYVEPITAPRSALDQARNLSGKLIVEAYRKLADENKCAPTSETSDQEIMGIYEQVVTAFRKASDQRGEHLTAGTLNSIVWKFLQVKEMLGSEMVEPHLNYEIEKYIAEGLRPDYQQEISLL